MVVFCVLGCFCVCCCCGGDGLYLICGFVWGFCWVGFYVVVLLVDFMVGFFVFVAGYFDLYVV